MAIHLDNADANRQRRTSCLFLCVNSGVLLLVASLATLHCSNAFQYVIPDGARWEIARNVGNGLKEPQSRYVSALSSRVNRLKLALRMSTQAGKTLLIQHLPPITSNPSCHSFPSKVIILTCRVSYQLDCVLLYA